MDLSQYPVYLFDLDGVITPTADVHMLAWGEMFNSYLTAIGGQAPYTDADYYKFVDGKPRYNGVRDFLASRGIELPEGKPTDDPSQESVCGLGNRKNEAFNLIIERDGVAAYPGSVALIERLVADGAALAVVSSSKNAPAVLRAADLIEHFRVIVDGNVAREQRLPGKPAPDTFAYAARQLGVTPDQCVVLEDALSGVAAGAAGEFGLVVGVDRGVGRQALADAGADIVVSDPSELMGE
ncbi:MAG: HAD family hydrolase [Arachnia sp.]